MSWHLLIHWADDFRHALAFTWAWQTWIGNVSAGIIIGAVMALLWPRLRQAIERWADAKLTHHLGLHHDRISETMKAHLDSHLASVKAHIDASNSQPEVDP